MTHSLCDWSALRTIRLPKVESVDDVFAALNALPVGAPGVSCLVESARGVGAAVEIATADPRVQTIALGEADLASGLGTRGDEALGWCRTRLVVKARAAIGISRGDAKSPDTSTRLTWLTVVAVLWRFYVARPTHRRTRRSSS